MVLTYCFTPCHADDWSPDRGDKTCINAALDEVGVVTSKPDVDIRCKMAYGMFDTRGKVGA
jgi:hypothetical protein